MRVLCVVIACAACVTEPVDVPEPGPTSRVRVIDAPLLRYPRILLYAICLPAVRACEGSLVDTMPDGTRREHRFESVPCDGDRECWELDDGPNICNEAALFPENQVHLDLTAFIADDAHYTFAHFECELE